MATPARTAGFRGRLPVRQPGERFAIGYIHEYATEPFPVPSYPVDVTGGIPADGWRMLGNGPDPACTIRPRGCGDCTFAGREHYKMAKAAASGQPPPGETSDQLVTEYFAYDHGQDRGAVIADLLLAWYRAGKILGFAPVDHTSKPRMDAAMQAFHGLYAGVSLTGDADQLFGEGQPWTVADGQQPDPAEGHCILKVRATGSGLDTWVTWGAEQESTEAWTAACLDEAWVILMTEDPRVDLARLRADIDALGGMGGVSPPDPAPVPPSAGGAVRELIADLRAVLAKAEAWLHAHGL